MKKKAINVLILFAVLAFGVLVTGTLAYWRSTGQSEGSLETGKLKGLLVQESAKTEELYPGDTVKQSVNVKNTGTLDMLVRLKVEKGWNGPADQSQIPADSLDSLNPDTDEVIKIKFNDQKWMAGSDGYFYYLGILKPGESTAEALYDEFMIDESVSNEYQGKSGLVSVQMECLQAAADAVSSWGMTYGELGVAEPEAKTAKASEVVFSKDKKFEFLSEGQDVFPSFKNLVPGESISQNLTIANQSSENITIFLKPETDSKKGAGKAEYIEKLLRQYAKIAITDSNGRSLYSGPVSASDTGEISLGNISSKEDLRLSVTLQLDPSIENEYQELAAGVNWKFAAQGEDGKKTTSTSALPKTGLEVMWPLLILGILAVIGALILIMAYTKRKDSNQNCKGQIE